MKGIKAKVTLFIAIIVLATTFLLAQQGRAQGVQPSIDVHRPFLYSDTRPAETFGPACAACHAPNYGFYDPQSFMPASQSAAPGQPDENHSPVTPGAKYSPIFSNDTLVGLWVSGHVGTEDLPSEFSKLP